MDNENQYFLKKMFASKKIHNVTWQYLIGKYVKIYGPIMKNID
jgi:hypothetical protein